MSLRNILIIGLFHSNNRMVIFLKQKKSYYSKHVRVHTFKTPHRRGIQGGGVGGGGGGEGGEWSKNFSNVQKNYC